jgi:hypothetical protein
MKLAFEKLLETNNLEVSELPKIIQIEIKELVGLKNLIDSKKTIGQNVTEQTMQKLKDKDNAVVDDILEFLDSDDEDETDDTSDDDTFDDDDTSDDDTSDEDEEDEDDSNDADGVSIDQELNTLFKSNQTELSINQLRSLAPVTYDCIFETYGKDEENGIVTSNYSIIETALNSETFKISKK